MRKFLQCSSLQRKIVDQRRRQGLGKQLPLMLELDAAVFGGFKDCIHCLGSPLIGYRGSSIPNRIWNAIGNAKLFLGKMVGMVPYATICTVSLRVVYWNHVEDRTGARARHH